MAGCTARAVTARATGCTVAGRCGEWSLETRTVVALRIEAKMQDRGVGLFGVDPDRGSLLADYVAVGVEADQSTELRF